MVGCAGAAAVAAAAEGGQGWRRRRRRVVVVVVVSHGGRRREVAYLGGDWKTQLGELITIGPRHLLFYFLALSVLGVLVLVLTRPRLVSVGDRTAFCVRSDQWEPHVGVGQEYQTAT